MRRQAMPMMQPLPLMPDMHMPPYYDPFMPLPELQVGVLLVSIHVHPLSASLLVTTTLIHATTHPCQCGTRLTSRHA